MLRSMSTDTGEVLLTRDELATGINVTPETISRLMTALERFGAVHRERVKIAGMKGNGPARYFINPDCAWRGSLAVREQASREKPTSLHLEVIDGGRT